MEFHVKNDAINEVIKKHMISRSLLFFAGGAIIVLYYIFFKDYNWQDISLNLRFFLLFFVIIFGLKLINRKKWVKIWQSYLILIDEDSITRKQDGLDDMTIRKEEITEIKEAKDGGLYILTNEQNKLIYIHPGTENIHKARELLSHWKVIEHAQNKIDYISWLIVAVVIILDLMYLHTNNLYYTLVSAAISAVFLIYAAIIYFKSPHITGESRRLLIFAAVIFTLQFLFKLFQLVLYYMAP